MKLFCLKETELKVRLLIEKMSLNTGGYRRAKYSKVGNFINAHVHAIMA